MTVTRKITISILAGTLLLVSAEPGLAKTYTVKATASDQWRKTHTYIGKGDRVIWKNPDSEDHDVTAYGGGWKLNETLSPGESVKKRFRKKGTFRYRCQLHSALVGGKCQGMCGFVHVL